MSRRLGMTALSAAAALVLAACGGEGAGGEASGNEGAAPEDLTIGVAMPTQTSERWIADGEAVQSQLEDWVGMSSPANCRSTW